MVKYRLPVIICLFVVLFALMVVGVREVFTSQVPGANDFLPRWVGARLYWQDGIDPYSNAATERIQQSMYGRLALPNEDQALFVYPFYSTFLLLPLVWLPLGYSWIQAIWLMVVLYALLGGLFIIRSLLRWNWSPLLLAILLLWGVFLYHSTRTIILGQFAAIVFLFLMLTLFALQRGYDGWAGFFLVWATIKPQMVIFVIPALLLWAIWQKRWHFVSSFVLNLMLLFALSFLLLPQWFSSFVVQVLTYPEYTAYANSPLGWLTGLWGGLVGKRLLQLLLLGWMVWEWRWLRMETAVSYNLFVILGVTFLTTSLIFDQTATTNQIALYLPLLTAAYALSFRHRYLVFALVIGMILGLWVLFLISVQGNLEHPIMYWALPLLTIFVLTAGRPFILRASSPHTISKAT